MEAKEGKRLIYQQLASFVNPSFWSKLTDLKLNVDKLDETERHLWGYFPLIRATEVPYPFLEVDSTSFNEEFNGQNTYIPFEGKIINKNTIEQFKECNKGELLNSVGTNIYQLISNSAALERPSVLNSFLIISFADLKKYHYYYWFAFPVIHNLVIEVLNISGISKNFSEESMQALHSGFKQLSDTQKPYFLFDSSKNEVVELKHMANLISDASHDIYFVFYNISNKAEFVGSQLRNFVVAILNFCPFLQGKLQNFIGLQVSRENSQLSIVQSVIYILQLPIIDNQTLLETWVGWEKNERDKMGPKMANMKNSLDPRILAESAVDLNLKLMKWRVVPDIDLELVKKTKCLLLGAGTLGCSVARSLLGWGVRNITFVDNSTVSFSNPVRQSLFTYEDSVKMRPKAEAAASRLREIFPGVESRGVQLKIPMPGHTVGESTLELTIRNVDTLVELIKTSDLIFLLMDSRESRWLPTLLGAFYNKLVINAALGFDSYLIMRHGYKGHDQPGLPSSSNIDGYEVIQGYNLGCYFCNEVTAPGDSLSNRTLDQQCTVTRPGVAQIAGAFAVELAISVLQHKERMNAPAFYKTSSAKDTFPLSEHQSLLGIVPHSLRGFLSSFNQIIPATMKYNQCVACSELILSEYESQGLEFLLKVFDSSKYLEDVAKLTDMFNNINFDEVLEFSDTSSE
ncbi:ubiquitin-like modifier-activating enzyme ATG7 [Euwallacea fornicatus]|uniref:ubiquitin-like modifier-activating enzyme ATG7 n=1 Tax=Euwallacea fornicatus TaxID=995702 RepID=UPI00338F9BCA